MSRSLNENGTKVEWKNFLQKHYARKMRRASKKMCEDWELWEEYPTVPAIRGSKPTVWWDMS